MPPRVHVVVSGNRKDGGLKLLNKLRSLPVFARARPLRKIAAQCDEIRAEAVDIAQKRLDDVRIRDPAKVQIGEVRNFHCR